MSPSESFGKGREPESNRSAHYEEKGRHHKQGAKSLKEGGEAHNDRGKKKEKKGDILRCRFDLKKKGPAICGEK